MRWIVVAMLILGACDRTPPTAPTPKTAAQTVAVAPAKSPSEVILAYYAAMAEADYAGAYAMVSEADRAARTLEDFTASASDPLQEALTRKRTFLVEKTTIEGDKALVMVDATGPDVARLQRIIVTRHMNNNPELPDAEGLKMLMRDALEEPDAPTLVTHQKLFLVKGADGAWMLDFDWDREHPHRGVPVQERPTKTTPDAGP